MEIEYKTIIEVQKKLSKMLSFTPEENWVDNGNHLFIMDAANVMMVVSKSEDGDKILMPFSDNERTDKIPELEFKTAGSSKFSIDYMKKIIDVLNIMDESIYLTNAKDHPVALENTHLKFILAPRVDNK